MPARHPEVAVDPVAGDLLRVLVHVMSHAVTLRHDVPRRRPSLPFHSTLHYLLSCHGHCGRQILRIHGHTQFLVEPLLCDPSPDYPPGYLPAACGCTLMSWHPSSATQNPALQPTAPARLPGCPCLASGKTAHGCFPISIIRGKSRQDTPVRHIRKPLLFKPMLRIISQMALTCDDIIKL